MDKDFIKALNLIQVKLDAPKNKTNKFGGFKYRNLEGILEGLKPLLKETGGVLIFDDEPVLVHERYYIKAKATFYCGEGQSSAVAFAREPEDKKGMDAAQLTGATSSYARKYALNALFCIDDTKDADHYDNKPEPVVKKPVVEVPKKLCKCGNGITGGFAMCWECHEKGVDGGVAIS